MTTMIFQQHKPSQKHQRGFILLLAVVFLALVLVIASTQADTVLEEFRAVGREERSLQALSAADTAVACVGFYDREQNAFDTRSPAQEYDCGVGTFTAGGINEAPAECAAHQYQFLLDGFSNGACADVTVTTIPASFMAGDERIYTCDLSVEARGKNTCDAAAQLVERVRSAGF